MLEKRVKMCDMHEERKNDRSHKHLGSARVPSGRYRVRRAEGGSERGKRNENVHEQPAAPARREPGRRMQCETWV